MAMAPLGLYSVLFCFCGSIALIGYRRRRIRLLPLPPTLPGWPVVGNAFQIPLTYPHLYYKELGKKLNSKIIYLEALGLPIIIINDVNVARDLLEKRSGLYSSRPQMTMTMEVVKARMFFGFLPYGNAWRNGRRLFQQYFSPRTSHREQRKALEFVRKGLLPNIYEKPYDIREHIRVYAGGLSIAITYGIPVRRAHEPLVDLAEQALTGASEASGPGNYLVNIFPMLKYLPGWLPGVTFKKVARRMRRDLIQLMEEPFDRALKCIDEGTATLSFVSENIDNMRNKHDPGLQEQHIKETASQVIGAMNESTVASTMTFILAMLIHPEIQRKVQQELDSVVGPDRLPDFSDQQDLPYLAAVLKEVLRWNPVAPMAVAHMTTEEDVYEGYYIPKDCTILPNTHAMLHDEKVFPNPTQFNPGRFIKDGVLLTDVLDPYDVATFGFGRRICPGAHIALSALYIVAASVLALFDISPALDADGMPIEVVPEFPAASLVSDPLPFRCKVVPRQGKDIGGLLQEYLGNEFI